MHVGVDSVQKRRSHVPEPAIAPAGYTMHHRDITFEDAHLIRLALRGCSTLHPE